MPGDPTVLALRDLWVEAPGPAAAQPLLRGVSLDLGAGRVAGLVGLSGAGKSLTACALAGLLPAPLRATRGSLRLAGREVSLCDPTAWRGVRGREVLLLMQMSGAALNPFLRVGRQIAETLRAVQGLNRVAARRLTDQALARVGLSPEVVRDYPHQLSGGMRRRVLLALAWALRPRVILADEPLTGLDPDLQTDMMGLLTDLAREREAALLVIGHDLRVLGRACSWIMVMEGGRVVDQGSPQQLWSQPGHRLTQELAASLHFLEGRGA
ncbi:MAG: ABC transporter ATP-binding protein [Desulfarculus sp.]|nr:ABC transporter ATP-binding protein [Desulfarculus sp.]